MTEHILIVEDEKHLGVGIKYNLEAEGYRATLVEDGATALRLINADPSGFQLVVLDLMLPGMSGYTVCESIRKAGLTTPVLMLSARTLAEDRTRGFDVGANQYLTKPFDLDELISRVKNLLILATNGKPTGVEVAKPAAKTTVDQASFGRVKVNFETHEVLVDDQPARITTKELRLLRYFVENADRVISRQELLSEVWGMTGNLQTRAVDQFIARLRKIIETNSTDPQHLLTLRDAGYRFISDPSETIVQESDANDPGGDRSDTL